MDAQAVYEECVRVVLFLIEEGLADSYNYPYRNETEVSFPNAERLSLALKKRSYEEIYRDLLAHSVYMVRFPDSSLMQLSYQFSRGKVVRHRLAFFPNPGLPAFDEYPELYSDNAWFADIADVRSVAVPLRFDYDADPASVTELWHPYSHLTLGCFQNCRIPVTSAVRPCSFIRLVLKAFYGTYIRQCYERVPKETSDQKSFEITISPLERSVIHIAVP